MNKTNRLRRLQLSRTSMRTLTQDLAGITGGRGRLISCDPGIGGSGCDPHCNETSETSTTTIIVSAIRC
jgi:hypothetical protein